MVTAKNLTNIRRISHIFTLKHFLTIISTINRIDRQCILSNIKLHFMNYNEIYIYEISKYLFYLNQLYLLKNFITKENTAICTNQNIFLN